MAVAERLLSSARGAGAEIVSVIPVAGDGSRRRFFRLHCEDGKTVMAVAPGDSSRGGHAEAHSAWKIGTHLFRAGVPVPEPLAWDEASGLILFEDLGDTRLHDLRPGEGRGDASSFIELYRRVVRELARMQVRGREGFDPAWCWQTPRYDRALMLERESGYFLESFCLDLLGLELDQGEVRREFGILADQASLAEADFFLHRDFQSRNIMVREGRVRFIDFQGGRLGPLAYDLASLLIDPYVRLTTGQRDELFDHYLDVLADCIPYDPARFREEYLTLALQRNLQILGAFGFLGGRRGKVFFLQFIEPALDSLEELLAADGMKRYPVLAGVIERCRDRFARLRERKEV
ncbi:MAG: hypothetical protein Kow0089_19310 [Desulfobulbaceae bacterium]